MDTIYYIFATFVVMLVFVFGVLALRICFTMTKERPPD
jgi:hypothetical protein